MSTMLKTVPLEGLHQPARGYVYLTFPSRAFLEQVRLLQASIAGALPDIAWMMPPKEIHITLCEIIQPAVTYGIDKDTIFEEQRVHYEQVLEEILRSVTSFNVRFDTIEVSQHAIIVRGNDDGQFNMIRDQLSQDLRLPPETRRPPDIIHSSIARFKQAVAVKSVQEVTTSLKFEVDETITEFKLIKTLVPPMHKYEVIRSYPLQA